MNDVKFHFTDGTSATWRSVDLFVNEKFVTVTIGTTNPEGTARINLDHVKFYEFLNV